MATLNEDQTAAANEFFQFLGDPTCSEFVIQGPAGTGKTTLISHLLNQIPKQERVLKSIGAEGFNFHDTYVTATTRKAAQVICEKLGFPNMTIHSLLGLKVENSRSTGETSLTRRSGASDVSKSLIIIDEASFIDEGLLEAIRSYTHECKVVYIGDPFQLTPAKSYSCPVFNGLMKTVKLTQIMRFDGHIDKLSAQYRDAVSSEVFPHIVTDDVQIRHVDGPTFQQLVEESFKPSFYTNNDKAKVVAWTNQRVHEYNKFIRAQKGCTAAIERGEAMITNRPIMERNGSVLYHTDAVVHVTSVSKPTTCKGVEGLYVTIDHTIEIFVATDHDALKQKLKELRKAKQWAEYFEILEHWADLRPPYACTVHKSQGSTYERVLIDLSDIGRCNIKTDVARMLYVAISRASKEVILYGMLPEKYQGGAYATTQNPCTQQTAA